MNLKTRLAPHIQKPGGGFWGWLAYRLMEARNRRMNEWAIALLDIQPHDYILEIGFGAGSSIARAAALATEGFVAGIDHSPDSVKRASRRNRAAIRARRVELRQGDAASLPYPDSMFDKAFCCGVIYYLPDPNIALREARRVLKPGGVLAVLARQPGALAQNPVFAEAGYRAYHADDLLALLRQAGFADAQCASRPPDDSLIAAIGHKALVS